MGDSLSHLDDLLVIHHTLMICWLYTILFILYTAYNIYIYIYIYIYIDIDIDINIYRYIIIRLANFA